MTRRVQVNTDATHKVGIYRLYYEKQSSLLLRASKNRRLFYLSRTLGSAGSNFNINSASYNGLLFRTIPVSRFSINGKISVTKDVINLVEDVKFASSLYRE